MFWIVSTVFFILLIAALEVAKIFLRKNEDDLVRPASIGQMVAGFLLVLFTVLACFDKVENGNVGLVYQFGAIVGQRNNPGIVFHAPWQSVDQKDAKVQSILPPSSCTDEAKTPHCLDAASSETQDVFVTATINIHVDPSRIQTLFKTVGPDYVNILVDPRVAQVTKEEIAKYKSTEVIPNREILRETIAKRLTEELSSESITVDDFLLTNVHFSNQFNTAIENSQAAEQDAKAELNKVASHQAQAAQAVADAKGQADAQAELGKGVATYNQEVNASLSPGLIQYITVQKLAPDVKVIMLPSTNGLILDVGSLTTGGTEAGAPTK